VMRCPASNGAGSPLSRGRRGGHALAARQAVQSRMTLPL
jgi:hypothetical protein